MCHHHERGLTLVELIITIALLGILASAAIPVTLFELKREKERELRRDLWEMRGAIDHYKDAADGGAVQIKADSNGYPPDLETLVNGIDIQGKRPEFPSGMTSGLRTRMLSWVMSRKWELDVGLAVGERCRRSAGLRNRRSSPGRV
jgi:general secretion pathway protein G